MDHLCDHLWICKAENTHLRLLIHITKFFLRKVTQICTPIIRLIHFPMLFPKILFNVCKKGDEKFHYYFQFGFSYDSDYIPPFVNFLYIFIARFSMEILLQILVFIFAYMLQIFPPFCHLPSHFMVFKKHSFEFLKKLHLSFPSFYPIHFSFPNSRF